MGEISWEQFEAVDMRVGRVVAVEEFPEVVNFPPKRIGPFLSEVLVLGAIAEAKGVILLRPDEDVEPGDRIA
jgi:tRNA-binding EMAP/Myf-like protein